MPFLGFYHRNKKDDTADYHAGVGTIKRRPPFQAKEAVKFYADKINHPVCAKDTIDNIPESPADYPRDGPALKPVKIRGG